MTRDSNSPAPGEYYRHYKGNIYKIIAIAKHSETLEEMVIYGDEKVNWARPKSSFCEILGDYTTHYRRFSRISMSDHQSLQQDNPR